MTTSGMARKREHETWRAVHHYVDVDRPFAEVSQLLAASPERVVGHPGGELHAARSDLHVRRGGVEVVREVQLSTRGIVVDEDIVRLSVRWEDARRPRLFPVLEAVVELTRLVADHREMTRVGLIGRYRPPLGAMGTIGDALAGRRLVLESVECFLDGVAQRLELEIPPARQGVEANPAPVERGLQGTAPRRQVGLRHVYLPVDELESRAGGAPALRDALAAIPGVAAVQINADAVGQMAIVDYDATVCSLSRLLDVIATGDDATGDDEHASPSGVMRTTL